MRLIAIVLRHLIQEQPESNEYLTLSTEKEVADNLPSLARAVMHLTSKIERSLLQLLDTVFEPFIVPTTKMAPENTTPAQMRILTSAWRLSLVSAEVNRLLENIVNESNKIH